MCSSALRNAYPIIQPSILRALRAVSNALCCIYVAQGRRRETPRTCRLRRSYPMRERHGRLNHANMFLACLTWPKQHRRIFLRRIAVMGMHSGRGR